MPDDPINEVVVIVPEDSGTLAANPAGTTDTSGSTSVTEEIIDVILDPFGSGDNPAETGTTPEEVVEEVFVVEPGADSSAAGGEVGATDPTDAAAAAAVADEPLGAVDPASDIPEAGGEGFATDPTDAAAAAAAADEPLGAAEPATDIPEAGGEGFATEPADTGDLTGTETAADDPAAGFAADPDTTATDPDTAVADPDAATADPTADTTDPDAQAQADAASDAQETLQQDEQAEAQAAASGDYATAQDDAQQAYSASQDLANAGGPDNTDETWHAAQDESWANWDQQTADENAQTAASFANDTTGNPDDAWDAELYGGVAESNQEAADDHGEAGEFGDSLGPEDSSAVAEEAPVDEAPAEEAPVEESSPVDDDSSAV
jgi:ABC-2 type transport system ATP-binding protein